MDDAKSVRRKPTTLHGRGVGIRGGVKSTQYTSSSYAVKKKVPNLTNFNNIKQRNWILLRVIFSVNSIYS